MTADRDALLDVLGAVEELLRQPADGTSRGGLADARDRARRHLDRTEYALPGSAHDTARAQSVLRRFGVIPNSATTPVVVEAFALVREEGRKRGVRPFRELFSGGPDTPCRTTYRDDSGAAPELEVPPTECVEVPLDEVRAAFVEAGEEP